VVSAIREQLSAVVGQSERNIMLGTILMASAVSGAMCFVLAQYYSVEVFSSLAFQPNDCWPMGMKVGRHCFNDYEAVTVIVARPNPWEPCFNIHPPYPAAGFVPVMIFALPAAWLHAPWLGLFGDLLVLTIAVLAPAAWAARGACGLERVVVFVALGAVAIPAWVVIDRANSTGFVAPIALVFLVALCRRRWGLVTIMVVLAALLKPQFAVLAVALFAARQWRLGGIALGGVVISNLAAYLLWWRYFPESIGQTIQNARNYGSSFSALVGPYNVSFAKAVLFVPDEIIRNKFGHVPDGFLAGPRSLIGGAVLVVVVVCLLAFGRRIPPVMAGIALLPTASLFPALTYHYYLVFVLPVAALVARDPLGPPGSGVFDGLQILGGRRRAIGMCVSTAAALTIAQFVLPGLRAQVVGMTPVVATTAVLTPILWLIACAAIIVSYARRPASCASTDVVTISASRELAPAAASDPRRVVAPQPSAVRGATTLHPLGLRGIGGPCLLRAPPSSGD
jgi:hypothetical protein